MATVLELKEGLERIGWSINEKNDHFFFISNDLGERTNLNLNTLDDERKPELRIENDIVKPGSNDGLCGKGGSGSLVVGLKNVAVFSYPDRCTISTKSDKRGHKIFIQFYPKFISKNEHRQNQVQKKR